MVNRPYQICTRCVMDTTDPQIEFDGSGICNHCTQMLKQLKDLKERKKLGEPFYEREIKKIKQHGKNRKYDALLGISGGVDSSYLALLLKEAGVRTLLVHVDNGWDSRESILNIKNIIQKLGFDFKTYVLDWNEFKELQVAFLKASVVEAETPTDLALQGALHRIAAKHRIKYIISGGNLATEGILPKLWHYNAKDMRYFKAIVQRFSKQKIRRFPRFGIQQELYYRFICGIRTIYLLNYVSFNPEKVIEQLKTKLGWENYGGKHHESHFTKFIQSYLLPKKFNLDYRKATLSSKICMGLVDRDEALELLQQPAFNEVELQRAKEYVAKKLGLSLHQLNEILEAPGKYYYEYPNDDRILSFIYGVYLNYFAR